MAAIRSKNTKPELFVRSLVHRLGFRFRLHGKLLPGKPDLVFASKKKVILVHGCFWHQHEKMSCCDARLPKSNVEYWRAKLTRNVERDGQQVLELRTLGWEVLTIWDCETHDVRKLQKRLIRFLS